MRTTRYIALSALLLVGARAAGSTTLEPRLKVAVEERYDDAARLGGASSGVGASQLMTKLSPQVGLDVADPTLDLSTWYSPDLLLHHGSGSVALDHRGELRVAKQLSRQSELETRAQVWRVTDPTSLPRLGLARTLAPILYGKLDLGAVTHLTERWEGRTGYRFEGARVYDAGAAATLYHAPFVSAMYGLTRRTFVGAEYRFQIFQLGSELALAHGAFAAYRYRLTRQATLTLKGGPMWFVPVDSTKPSGALPRVSLELSREGQYVDLALAAGQDLVGASGFSSALWADYASVMMAWRVSSPVRLFANANYYRNGHAPHTGLNPFGPTAGEMSQGYAVGGGAEWRMNKSMSFLVTADRFEQVGTEAAEADVARNIAALRMVITAW